jgi:hypothetical protein
MNLATVSTTLALMFFCLSVLAMFWKIYQKRKEFNEYDPETPQEMTWRGKKLYMNTEEYLRFCKLSRKEKRDVIQKTEIAIKKGHVKIIEDENGINRLITADEYREVNNR